MIQKEKLLQLEILNQQKENEKAMKKALRKKKMENAAKTGLGK